MDHKLLRPETAKIQKLIINRHIEPVLKSGESFTDFYYRLAQNYSFAYIKLIFVLLRDELETRNIEYNKLELSEVYKAVNRNAEGDGRHALSRKEAEDFLHVCRERHRKVYAHMLFALHTGARLNEMRTVKWKDLVEDNGTFKVSIQRGANDNKPKYGGVRTVPVSTELKSAIDELWKSKARVPHRESHVFRNTKHLGEVFRDIEQVLGWERNRVSYHVLRHTFATLLLEQGVSIKDVQTLLGHKNASTTIDVYWSRANNVQIEEYLVRRRTE